MRYPLLHPVLHPAASAVVMIVLGVATSARPQSRYLPHDTPTYRIQPGARVLVSCTLTGGGRFEATTTALEGEFHLDLGHTDGSLGSAEVDLTTLETGIELRNAHMLEKYLEVARGADFETAKLSEIHLQDFNPLHLEGTYIFTASFRLHGEEHPIQGSARIEEEGDALLVRATFRLRVTDFGIKQPSFLGVGIKNEVQVRVELRAVAVVPMEARR